MAITQAMCSSFKEQLLEGDHDLLNDNLKMALYTSSADLGATTTAYETANEVSTSGTNYTAGGVAVNNVTVTLTGTTAHVDFENVVFENVDLTARGAIIYNTSATNTNAAIAVLNFVEDKTATDGNFTVIMPTDGSSTSIIRIA